MSVRVHTTIQLTHENIPRRKQELCVCGHKSQIGARSSVQRVAVVVVGVDLKEKKNAIQKWAVRSTRARRILSSVDAAAIDLPSPAMLHNMNVSNYVCILSSDRQIDSQHNFSCMR